MMARLAGDARRSRYVDTSTSRCGRRPTASLVADDGLHPSGAQYALWVERLVPVVGELLARALSLRAGRRSRSSLVEAGVADPEVMGDLVVDRVGHAGAPGPRASGTRGAAARGRS